MIRCVGCASEGILWYTDRNSIDEGTVSYKNYIDQSMPSSRIPPPNAERPWKYRSRSNVITCDTPSDANDDLCQKRKECKQMLLIICTKYGKNPSWTVDATGRTRKVNGQRDRQTDGQTNRQTDRVNPIYPPNFVAGSLINAVTYRK